MIFELRLTESLGANVRRLLCEQIDGARNVTGGENEPGDTRVHAIRKHLKKARAILSLVRKAIDPNEFDEQRRGLRDVGRLIRELRDAEVRLQTLRQLEDALDHHYRSYRKIEALLTMELESFTAAFDGWEEMASATLRDVGKTVATWSLESYGPKQLRRAIQFSYRSCREAVLGMNKHPTTAEFHEVRKRVKLLGYQLRVARPLNPVVISSLTDELTRLGHLFGRIHDLSFLADRLRRERSEKHWGKQDEDLLAAIESSQSELQLDGTQMVIRFFSQPASEFGCFVRQWLSHWRPPTCHTLAEELLST